MRSIFNLDPSDQIYVLVSGPRIGSGACFAGTTGVGKVQF